MRRGDRGIALLMTLWVLVLLTVIAMNFVFSARLGSAGTRNFKDDTIAYYRALAAMEDVKAYLLTDKDPGLDFTGLDGLFRTDEERESAAGGSREDGVSIVVSIADEGARLNLNSIDEGTLRRLLEFAQVPDDAVVQIVDAAKDWRDQDDLHHLSGAEDDYYEEFGYRAKDGDFDVPGELLLLRGFAPEYWGPSEEGASLSEFVTTWGDGRINVNTVRPEVLDLMGVPADERDEIVKRREMKPYETPPGTMAGRGTTVAATVRVEVLARVGDSPMGVRLSAVMDRAFGPEGPSLRTVYWREGFEPWSESSEREAAPDARSGA
jgi:general secretion pathway protein K